MSWEYEELLEAFMEDYLEYKKRNMSDREALARTFVEYETVLNQGEMEKAVIHVLYGELLLTQSKVFVTAKERTKEDLNSLEFNKIREQISLGQFEDLLTRRNHVLQEIDQKPQDFCSEARWYYNEMAEEVNKCFNKISSQNKNVGEAINSVLLRFKRDCDNTLSERIIVFTTLAENLLSFNLTETKEIKKIKKELHSFSIEDIGEQLSEEEKEKLKVRIKNVVT